MNCETNQHDLCETATDMLLSVVVPVYNSSSTLEALVRRLCATIETLGGRFEIIFVDDGSRDDSWATLCDLHARYAEHVVVVQLTRNFGQHNAIMCGLEFAQGEFVVTLDDDLQNPPEEIPRLLSEIRERSLDVVYGVPMQKKHHVGRNLGSKLVNWFFRRVFNSSVTVTSYRIMRREIVKSILVYDLNFTYIDGLLAWNTSRFGSISVEHDARGAGRSGYSFSKLFTLALNLFTNFSLLPLQLTTLLGIVASTCSFVLGIYTLICYFFAKVEVSGYASTIVAVLGLGGLQLLSLGIHGEYLGRLHLNVNHKPQYTIRTSRRAAAENAANSSSTSR
ncbi:MAG: glycosyltransferase family 2 protein [Planctomycetales bacterium]|nr:glycosyltransferase family 2 protein [Planctomycetales bacterium]